MKPAVILSLAALVGGIAASAVLPAVAQAPSEPAAKPAAPKPTPRPKAPPKPSVGCAWIGTRVIHALIRDDVVAAGDFQRLYQTFGCPGAYLRPVLDCVVKNGTPVPGGQAQERVASCWEKPTGK